MLTLNVLTAADTVMIPIQCEYYALQGLAELLNTIRLVQQNLNPKLSIEGALLTILSRAETAPEVARLLLADLLGLRRVDGVLASATILSAAFADAGRPICG